MSGIEGLSEMDIQEWAFNNESKVLEEAKMTGCELISFEDKGGLYRVVGLYRGGTIVSLIESKWVEQEITS